MGLEIEIPVQAVSQGTFSGEREAGEDWGKKLSKDVVSAPEEPDPTGSERIWARHREHPQWEAV